MPQNGGKKGNSELFLRIRQIGILSAVPFILLLGPLIGYFLGHWIDRKFGFYPYATMGFIVLGFLASARETARMIREVIRDQ